MHTITRRMAGYLTSKRTVSATEGGTVLITESLRK
jgi:hypothetical protein